MQRNKKTHQNKGFTLVELIVVLTVLAIVAGFAVPSLLGYIANQKGRQCETNRKALVSHLDEALVASSSATMADMLTKYPDQAKCPETGESYTASGSNTVVCEKHGSSSWVGNTAGDFTYEVASRPNTNTPSGGGTDNTGTGETDTPGAGGDSGGTDNPGTGGDTGGTDTPGTGGDDGGKTDPSDPGSSGGQGIISASTGTITVNQQIQTDQTVINTWEQLREIITDPNNSVNPGDLTGRLIECNNKVYFFYNGGSNWNDLYSLIANNGGSITADSTLEEAMALYPNLFKELNQEEIYDPSAHDSYDTIPLGTVIYLPDSNAYYVVTISTETWGNTANNEAGRVKIVNANITALENKDTVSVSMGDRAYKTSCWNADQRPSQATQSKKISYKDLVTYNGKLYIYKDQYSYLPSPVIYNFSSEEEVSTIISNSSRFLALDTSQIYPYDGENSNDSAYGKIVSYNGSYYTNISWPTIGNIQWDSTENNGWIKLDLTEESA